MPVLPLRSKAWFGDEESELSIPANWAVTTLPPADSSAIPDHALAATLQNTYGSPPLNELARQKSNALIVVDELTRPAPTARIIPHLLKALIQAGMVPSEISFLIATGSHRPITRAEAEKKLGKDVVARFPVANHDAFGSDLQQRGKLSSGMPLIVNRQVAEASWVIGISSVLPHSSTGFSGGGKLILPGTAGLLSIAHLHSFELRRPRGALERTGNQHDARDTINAFAQRAGLDFSINVVVNSKREIAGIFCGSLVDAHREAAIFARNIYRTEVPRDVFDNTNLLLLNAYPLDADATQTSKALWPQALFPGSRCILFNAASAGFTYHGWSNFQRASILRLLWGSTGLLASRRRCPEFIGRVLRSPAIRAAGNWHFRRLIAKTIPGYHWSSVQAQAHPRGGLAAKIMADKPPITVCSAAYPRTKVKQHFPRGVLFSSWEEVRKSDLFREPEGRLTFFPCAPLQLPLYSS